MEFKNKNVLVCGLGISGYNSALLLKKLGANVTVQDLKNKENFLDYINILKKNDINLYLGQNPTNELIDKMDIMVVSPGIPSDTDFILYAKSKIIVISEIELAYLNCPSDNIIAITGTNGKTTTTSIVYEIVNKFKNAFIVGNIGTPFSQKVLEIKKDDIVVTEVSSFQLELINNFKPKIAAILNITEDHLNVHKTMENYIKAKEKIFENQTENDYLILNYDDKILKKLSSKSKILYFSSNTEITNGAYLKDDFIFINCFAFKNLKFIDTKQLKILGIHNFENVMASILMSLCLNIPLDIIKERLINFAPIEHRIEFVCFKNDVPYFNDSKATNIQSAIKAILAMQKPIHLIAGGYDKKVDFAPLVAHFKNNVKNVVLIGEVKDKIAMKCQDLHFNNYQYANSLEEAVNICYKNAKKDECVLLSPACASFDMFKNYEERGKLFKKYVENLDR